MKELVVEWSVNRHFMRIKYKRLRTLSKQAINIGRMGGSSGYLNIVGIPRERDKIDVVLRTN